MPKKYDLWNEYNIGVGGAKAARLYTSKERGANRYIYSLRKVFWDAVDIMIRSGMSNDNAIDKIYGIYGSDKSCTEILRRMRHDRKNNNCRWIQ
jgi:hypothetical protein